MISKGHVQVPVKINAWADSGIAPLVEALNEFPDLWTTSSCQGHADVAYVYFAFRGTAKHFAAFVGQFSCALGKRIHGDKEYRLTLEWTAGGEMPLGAIVARREVVPLLVTAIRQIAVNFVHKSPYRRGIHGRGLRNLRDHPDRQRSAR